MTRASFFRRCIAGIACLLAVATAGCEGVESAPPACGAGIRAQDELLRAPGLEALKFHKRTNYDASRGAGSDLWADSRFEYRAAVEFQFVPSRNPAHGGRFCADAVSIRLTLPMDEPRRQMLRAFVRAASSGTAFEAGELQSRIDERLAQRAKYAPISKQGGVSAEAGEVTHPSWGDLFVVTFASE